MTERPRVRTVCPEYGLVRTVVLVGVFAVVVAAAAPAIARAVGADAVEYALYALAAGGGLVALRVELRRQARRNPHEFVAREVLEQFYAHQRPTLAGHLSNLVLVAAGVAAVARGAEPALGRREGALLVLERWAAGEPLPAIDPVNAGWGVVTVVGVALLAVGLDRLLVGGYREFRYRRARR